MKRPEEFNEDQWQLILRFRVTRIFSSFVDWFGPQFFMLYVMQHLTISQKSVQTMAGTITGLATVMVLTYPFVKKNIHNWVMPVSILGLVMGLACNMLIIQHPVLVLFILSIAGKAIGSFVQKGFGKLLNRAFQGDAKTVFGFIHEQVDMIGICLASIACWICSDVQLMWICVADSVLITIDTFATWYRYGLVRDYLEHHPYLEEKE